MMDAQYTLWILGIVGILIMIGLSINGFFLKEIISGLNDVRVRLAELSVESRQYGTRLDKLEKHVDKLRNE